MTPDNRAFEIAFRRLRKCQETGRHFVLVTETARAYQDLPEVRITYVSTGRLRDLLYQALQLHRWIKDRHTR